MQITNPVSQQIWKDRYCKNGETLEENLKRVAKFCANDDEEKKMFFEVMDKGLFFPAGRTMSNAGIGRTLTLNNCFTVPMIKDDMSDIFDKLKIAALTHKAGGGTGFSFSQLRPKGSPTSNDAIASGAVSFMDVYNAQTATIMQGSRRGANMGVMSVYSMDIEDFITAKSKDPNRLCHFNISVMVDDDFMLAKEKGEDIWLHYPVYDENGQLIKDPSKWIYKKRVNARYLWELIVREAYNTGEPGVLFADTMNRDNNIWYIEQIVCTNPCGEYVAGTVYGTNPKTGEKLNPDDYGGACNLGSIFLHNFVRNPFTNDAYFDWEKLEQTIKVAVRFLDNIIDKNHYPHKIYENYQKSFRTIGLGVTGLADMLCMLGIRYNSEEAIEFVDNLMNFIALNAYLTSIELAKEKGEFPLLDREKFIQSGYLQKHLEVDDRWQQVVDGIKQYGIRNARLLSVAPTGTLSLTFGNNCSSGMEPIFQLEYDRKVKIGGQDESNARIVKMRDYAYDLWLKTENKTVGKDVFVTALEMSVDDHINMLKTVAFHVDMGVSKTINIPEDYSFEQTKKVYDKCWKAGIKGCTIFRPNPIRQGVLLTNTSQQQKKTINQLDRGVIISTADDLLGKKRKLITGCGSLHLLAFFDPDTGGLMETYFAKGSTGGCQSFMVGLSRMISLAARGGINIDAIIDQLKSTPTCPAYATRKATKNDTSKGICCPDAIANALKEMHKEVLHELGLDEEDDEVVAIANKLSNKEKQYIKEHGEIVFAKNYGKCPNCGQKLENVEGCLSCKDCGWSKCG